MATGVVEIDPKNAGIFRIGFKDILLVTRFSEVLLTILKLVLTMGRFRGDTHLTSTLKEWMGVGWELDKNEMLSDVGGWG